eukprot:scaffold13014_cov90-Isochrysis_galbana.AAC.1
MAGSSRWRDGGLISVARWRAHLGGERAGLLRLARASTPATASPPESVSCPTLTSANADPHPHPRIFVDPCPHARIFVDPHPQARI